MTDILASGVSAVTKYDNRTENAEKVLPRLDMRLLAVNLQYLLETTRGYSFSGNEGYSQAQNTLSTITASNYLDYQKSLLQTISTLVSHRNYLDVDPASTANAITLIKSKITTENAPNGQNYARENELPFKFKNNLTFTFKAKDTNTGPLSLSIPALEGFTGSIPLVNQDLTSLSQNDIIQNYIYEITADATNNRFILTPHLRKATNLIQGVSFINNPVQVVNDGLNPNDTVGFVAGTFITSAGNQIYLPTIRKKIQSSGSFTAGDNNNGLDTGARTANTFYRTFVIQNTTTSAYDILFVVSGSTPLVPSGYTNLGLMDYALIRTNASNIIAISKWDVNNKKLVLGRGEQILVVNSGAGSGNATILNTTEPLEFEVQATVSLTGAGGSDFSVYGSEHDPSNPNDCLIVTTNNGFSAYNNGSVYTSDGKIYWKNFSTSGGIANQRATIKSIKIRN